MIETKPDSQTILVTGASGSLGRHIVKGVIEAGHRPILYLRQDDPNLFPDVQRAFSKDGLAKAMEGVPVVINAAGKVGWGPKEAKGLYAELEEANVTFTKKVMHAASEAQVKRVILLGSVVVYGSPSKNNTEEIVFITEDFPLLSTSAYGDTKAQAERVILNSDTVDGRVARAASAFGEEVDARSRDIYERLSHHQPFLVGRGNGVIQYSDAADIARGMIAAAFDPTEMSRTFNLVSGSFTQREIVEAYSLVVDEWPIYPIPAFVARNVGRLYDIFSAVTGRPVSTTLELVQHATNTTSRYSTERMKNLGLVPTPRWKTMERTLLWLNEEYHGSERSTSGEHPRAQTIIEFCNQRMQKDAAL